MHVIFSSRFVGSYDQLQGIQADPNRLYVAYAGDDWQLLSGWSRSHLASQVMQKCVGQIGCQNSRTTQGKSFYRPASSNGSSLQPSDMRLLSRGKLNLPPLRRRIEHPHTLIGTCHRLIRRSLGGHWLEPRESTSKLQWGMHGTAK